MRHGYLRLKFQDDFDGTGKLLATAEASGFAGRDGAWFGIAEVEEFANSLAAYPLPHDRPLVLCGGFWKDSQLTQEHLAIHVQPIDHKGHIGVQIRTASELWNGRPQSQMAVRLELITSYQPLLDFSKSLKALVHGAATEILLEGESD